MAVAIRPQTINDSTYKKIIVDRVTVAGDAEKPKLEVDGEKPPGEQHAEEQPKSQRICAAPGPGKRPKPIVWPTERSIGGELVYSAELLERLQRPLQAGGGLAMETPPAHTRKPR